MYNIQCLGLVKNSRALLGLAGEVGGYKVIIHKTNSIIMLCKCRTVKPHSHRSWRGVLNDVNDMVKIDSVNPYSFHLGLLKIAFNSVQFSH